MIGRQFCFSRIQESFGARTARLWRMAMDPIVWVLVIDSISRRIVYWLQGVSFLPLYILCASLMLRSGGITILLPPSSGLARPSITKTVSTMRNIS